VVVGAVTASTGGAISRLRGDSPPMAPLELRLGASGEDLPFLAIASIISDLRIPVTFTSRLFAIALSSVTPLDSRTERFNVSDTYSASCIEGRSSPR
jgi:hypothetical protein